MGTQSKEHLMRQLQSMILKKFSFVYIICSIGADANDDMVSGQAFSYIITWFLSQLVRFCRQIRLQNKNKPRCLMIPDSPLPWRWRKFGRREHRGEGGIKDWIDKFSANPPKILFCGCRHQST